MATQYTESATRERKQHRVTNSASSQHLIDLEFSEYLRDRRMLAGWWIVPSLLLGLGLLAFAVV
jgi:hypothetical protein